MASVSCILQEHGAVLCNGTKYVLEEEPLNYKDSWFWIYLGIYVFLVLFAGKLVRPTYLVDEILSTSCYFNNEFFLLFTFLHHIYFKAILFLICELLQSSNF